MRVVSRTMRHREPLGQIIDLSHPLGTIQPRRSSSKTSGLAEAYDVDQVATQVIRVAVARSQRLC